MNRDNICDYVISMFRFYASNGEPDIGTIRNLRATLPTAAILDLVAVDNTLRILENEGEDETVKVIRAVYFALPDKALRKGDISRRITKYAMNNFNGERTVWRRLAMARRICAEERNLRIN